MHKIDLKETGRVCTCMILTPQFSSQQI